MTKSVTALAAGLYPRYTQARGLSRWYWYVLYPKRARRVCRLVYTCVVLGVCYHTNTPFMVSAVVASVLSSCHNSGELQIRLPPGGENFLTVAWSENPSWCRKWLRDFQLDIPISIQLVYFRSFLSVLPE